MKVYKYRYGSKRDSYQFEYVEIEDLFKDSPKYKSNIKSIDKSLIDYNDYGWGVEKQYFDRGLGSKHILIIW